MSRQAWRVARLRRLQEEDAEAEVRQAIDEPEEEPDAEQPEPR